ncbi:MAG: SOS response-associated peptidase, partial [Rhodospirillales bacterium]|nr:SOS response-associated peptidase [Rhodospirillales bacterium]MCW8953146.1 SOS response-associated peptidase [Rhodospirillales bacterium]
FTIVTCPPAPSIAHIHNRMPVVLGVENAKIWLDRDAPFDTVRGILHPPEDGLIKAVEESFPLSRQKDLFEQTL